MRLKRNKWPASLSAIYLLLLAAVLMGATHYASRISERRHPSINGLGLSAEEMLEVDLPDSIPSQIVNYTGFTVSFNRLNHTPNYSAWKLLGANTRGETKRSGGFHRDNKVRGCAKSSDYTRSGYDRGHLCPAADQKWSKEAMRDCFSMANICPQKRVLNGKAWQKLEELSRMWAERDSAIIIIAGPIYEQSDTLRIGESLVRVPSAYFKAIMAPFVKKPRAIAFVFPNELAAGDMYRYAVSIDELENITGFDFFNTLPDSIENELESDFQYLEWTK